MRVNPNDKKLRGFTKSLGRPLKDSTGKYSLKTNQDWNYVEKNDSTYNHCLFIRSANRFFYAIDAKSNKQFFIFCLDYNEKSQAYRSYSDETPCFCFPL